MNRSETARLLQEMTERWPSWRLPTAPGHLMSLIGTWTTDLEPVPETAALEAVRSAALDGREWPPPLGWVVVEGLRRSGVPMPPEPDEAWDEVQQQMSSIGAYGSPRWSHEAIRTVVRTLGGWQTLCRSEDGMADRAHFLRMYPPLRQRAIVEACARPEYPALPAPAPVVELEEPATVVAVGPAAQDERLSAVKAARASFAAAAPHPNRKRPRSDP